MENPYNIRLGKVKIDGEPKSLKAQLESIAFDKEIDLPDLIRRVLRGYVKKVKSKQL